MPLGRSSDPLSNFSLQYTVLGFEPEIRATLFDDAGMPIFFSRADGQIEVSSILVALAPIADCRADLATALRTCLDIAGHSGWPRVMVPRKHA